MNSAISNLESSVCKCSLDSSSKIISLYNKFRKIQLSTVKGGLEDQPKDPPAGGPSRV